MSTREAFSRNLKKYMDLNGENQTELAKVLGCTSAAVSDWVLGKKVPRMDKIAEISRHYGCSYSDLLGDGLEDVGEDTVVMFYRALSPEAKQQLIDYASFLVGKERRRP